MSSQDFRFKRLNMRVVVTQGSEFDLNFAEPAVNVVRRALAVGRADGLLPEHMLSETGHQIFRNKLAHVRGLVYFTGNQGVIDFGNSFEELDIAFQQGVAFSAFSGLTASFRTVNQPEIPANPITLSILPYGAFPVVHANGGPATGHIIGASPLLEAWFDGAQWRWTPAVSAWALALASGSVPVQAWPINPLPVVSPPPPPPPGPPPPPPPDPIYTKFGSYSTALGVSGVTLTFNPANPTVGGLSYVSGPTGPLPLDAEIDLAIAAGTAATLPFRQLSPIFAQIITDPPNGVTVPAYGPGNVPNIITITLGSDTDTSAGTTTATTFLEGTILRAPSTLDPQPAIGFAVGSADRPLVQLFWRAP